MFLIQLLLLALLLPLAYGPVGHAALAYGGPNLLLVSLWLFTWLTDRRTATNWAMLAGLSADLLGFYRFGLTTVEFLVMTYFIDYLRRRFFQISSLIEALGTLAIVTLIDGLFRALLAQQIVLGQLLVSILANVIIGAIAYYILAIRFRMFARWAGQRL